MPFHRLRLNAITAIFPERLDRILAARWWYVVALGYYLASVIRPELTLRSAALSRVCEVLVLLVCVGRFMLPSRQLPGSTLARGWQVLAFQWLLLALYRAAGRSMADLYGWATVALSLVVYVPSLIVIIACFVVLPFGQRRRGSVLLDWLAVSGGLTVAVTVLLRLIAPEAALLDGLFVGGDLSTLYALLLIRRQQPTRWSQLFAALAVGILAIALVDVAWVIHRAAALSVLTIGPLYTIAWLIFSRAALVTPADSATPDPSRLALESTIYQLAPYLLLAGGLVIVLALDEQLLAVMLLLLLLLLRIGVEIGESRSLSLRLDDSRRAEHAARAEAEHLRELIRASIHDLRSPVDGGAGVLTLLEASPDSPRRGRLFDLLRTQLDDISDQMTDLLDVVRVGAAPAPLQPVDLVPLIVAEIERARQIASYRQPRAGPATITMLASAESLKVWGSPRQIGRVLANLLKNALEHGGEQITVDLELSDSEATLVVRDNGPGYPQRLVRSGLAPGWSGRAEGYGFGLIGVAANLALLDARITLSNAAGAHTAVTLRRVAGS